MPYAMPYAKYLILNAITYAPKQRIAHTATHQMGAGGLLHRAVARCTILPTQIL